MCVYIHIHISESLCHTPKDNIANQLNFNKKRAHNLESMCEF